MLKKTTFIAWLFVMAGCSLLVGGISLYENMQFWFDGQSGFMESADKQVALAAKYNQYDNSMIEVSYVTPNDRVVVPQKMVVAETVKRLSKGERIPVRFLKHNHQRALLDDQKPDSPWGWLIVGAVFAAVSTFALRQFRRETESAS